MVNRESELKVRRVGLSRTGAIGRCRCEKRLIVVYVQQVFVQVCEQDFECKCNGHGIGNVECGMKAVSKTLTS